jgi:hypothetical protein
MSSSYDSSKMDNSSHNEDIGQKSPSQPPSPQSSTEIPPRSSNSSIAAKLFGESTTADDAHSDQSDGRYNGSESYPGSIVSIPARLSTLYLP